MAVGRGVGPPSPRICVVVHLHYRHAFRIDGNSSALRVQADDDCDLAGFQFTKGQHGASRVSVMTAYQSWSRSRSILPTVAIIGIATSASAAPILQFNPAPTTVGFSQAFSVDVLVRDVNDLASVGFDVEFDPALLELNPVLPATEGGFLQSAGATSFLTLADVGFISISIALDASIPSGVSTMGTPGVLATLNFRSLSTPGTSALTFSNIFLFDLSNAVELQNGRIALPLNAAPESGSVTVSEGTPVVPEPTTIFLVGTGVFASLRRRRREE